MEQRDNVLPEDVIEGDFREIPKEVESEQVEEPTIGLGDALNIQLDQLGANMAEEMDFIKQISNPELSEDQLEEMLSKRVGVENPYLFLKESIAPNPEIWNLGLVQDLDSIANMNAYRQIKLINDILSLNVYEIGKQNGFKTTTVRSQLTNDETRAMAGIVSVIAWIKGFANDLKNSQGEETTETTVEPTENQVEEQVETANTEEVTTPVETPTENT